MSRARRLCFELMEPRIAMSADLDSLFEKVSQLSPESLGSTDALATIRQFLIDYQDDVDSFVSEPIVINTPHVTANSVGDGQAVQFRIDLRDENGQSVDPSNRDGFKLGQTYTANIFIRDTRHLETVASDAGGVFQAIVDLQLSENVRQVSPWTLGSEFFSRQKPSIESGIGLQTIEAISRSSSPLGQSEQLLLQTSLVIESAVIPTQIRVIPSASSNESVLLYGLNSPVPAENMGAAVWGFAAGNEPRPDSSSDIDSSFVSVPPAGSLETQPSLTPPHIHLDFATSRFDRTRIIDRVLTFDLRDSHLDDTDSTERESSDSLLELELPLESSGKKARKASSAQDSIPFKEDEEEEQSDETELGSGWLYDDQLFLQLSLVEPLQSQFRLHFQIFSSVGQSKRDISESKATTNGKRTSNRVPADRWADLAEILSRDDRSNAWSEDVERLPPDDALAKLHREEQLGRAMAMTFELSPQRTKLSDAPQAFDQTPQYFDKDPIPKSLQAGHEDAAL